MVLGPTLQHYSDNIDLKGRASIRLDQYIAEYLNLLSRSQLKNQLTAITLNGQKAKLSAKVQSGMHLEFSWQAVESALKSNQLALNILYEDENVWVINKPQGLVVHPGAGHYSHTLANGLRYLMEQVEASDRMEEAYYKSPRVGIVHRLDRETSGVMICAKHSKAHEFLADQFKYRQVQKRYMAIVEGNVTPPTGVIDNYLDRSRKNRKLFTCGNDETRGRRAITAYKVLETYGPRSLMLFKPYTGRTHQLRVHAAYMDHPIVGDPLYNRAASGQSETLMLHAWKIKIRLPHADKPQIFCAEVPARFYACLQLRKQKK